MEPSAFMPPLLLKSQQVMRLLNVRYASLTKLIAAGRLHPVGLFSRNKMFAYSEVVELAKVPAKK